MWIRQSVRRPAESPLLNYPEGQQVDITAGARSVRVAKWVVAFQGVGDYNLAAIIISHINCQQSRYLKCE